MPGCVDDHVRTLCCLELNLRRVDGDSLLLFFLKRVEQISVLERLARLVGDAPNLLDDALGQRMRVEEQASDNSRFAVIDRRARRPSYV